jgi:hypothetical protein
MLNLAKYKEKVERASKESGRRSGRLDKKFVLDLLEAIEDEYSLNLFSSENSVDSVESHY